MRPEWQRLCRRDEVPDGGAIAVPAQVDGEPVSVILLRKDERIEAFLNICPHAGRPLNWAPGRFLIESGLLICAAHGATFTIPDGHCVGGPCRGSRLRALPLCEVEGELRLGVPAC